jgi:hypothetical protein
MTSPHLPRPTGLVARGALIALILAGCAGTAESRDRAAAPAPARTAILADAGTSPTAIAAATTAPAPAIRRASGPLDAQALAVRLAAEGYDTIVAIGPDARAAISQAAAAEVGPDIAWRTAPRR